MTIFYMLFITLLALNPSLPQNSDPKDPKSVLSQKINLEVQPRETLESIIYRISKEPGITIVYNTIHLSPYAAKKKIYTGVTVGEILTDQLEGTPVKFKVKNKVLIIY